MADKDFEVSATHLAGMVKAAAKLGVMDKVRPKVSAATLAVMDAPYSAKWHPSQALVELSDALRIECGEQAFTEAVYVMTSESFGPIVTPMLKIALTITGRTPATLFARLHESVQLTMRGVNVTWKSTGPQGGVVEVRYPRPIPAEVRFAFEGVFRFVFGLTGHQGKIEAWKHEEGGKLLALTVGWK